MSVPSAHIYYPATLTQYFEGLSRTLHVFWKSFARNDSILTV